MCLPSAHEGGVLVVRHDGRCLEFDWSGPAPNSIQWAAFYSDCEHEVMPLESGHRITLTYNLYHQTGRPQPRLPLPMHSFPLYHDLQAALQNPGFVTSGSILGFYCNHGYPHSSAGVRQTLPMALKGVDLLIYGVCRSLGLKATARPILEFERNKDYHYGSKCSDLGGCSKQECADEVYNKARGRLRDFQHDGFHVPRYTRMHMDVEESILPEFQNTTDDPAKHPLAQHELTLKYRELDPKLRKQQDDYAPIDPDAQIEYLKTEVEVEGLSSRSDSRTVRVGSKFHQVKTLDYVLEIEEIEVRAPHSPMPDSA